VVKEEIFEHLSLRERIRLERVCRIWRTLSQTSGWTRLRFLSSIREQQLKIVEPWKDVDQIEHKVAQLCLKQTEVRG
jgi:hypothetical protein